MTRPESPAMVLLCSNCGAMLADVPRGAPVPKDRFMEPCPTCGSQNRTGYFYSADFRPGPTDGALASRRERRVDHERRARALRTDGLSARQIGIRMGRDDGRDAYDSRQVRRWLAGEKG